MPNDSTWRCLHCNYKTPKWTWKNKIICPICDSCEGYKVSSHGSLSEGQIAEARRMLISNIINIEERSNLTNGGNERQY